MVDVSKTVADRLTYSEQVIQAIEVQGAAVIGGITSNVGGQFPRDVVVSAVIAWLGSHLRGAHDALRSADLAHNLELTDDAGPRRERDEATTALRQQLIAASNVVRGAHGDAFSTAVGLEAALEERPDLLLTQGRSIVGALRGTAAPAVQTPGVRLDRAALTDAIEVTAARLADALTTVRREEREAQSTLSARDQAMSRWARVYAGVGEVFSGLCTLAGLDDLASKVRPTARRRAGIPDGPVTPPPV